MKQYPYKSLIFILPTVLLIIFFAIWRFELFTSSSKTLDEPHVVINNEIIYVEIADNMEEQWQGLSDRDYLPADRGMLFVFSDYRERAFVMRRMSFPLDIIFIKNDRIVKIYEDLEPEGENPVRKYDSLLPINYVLEVNGGFAKAKGIKEGDTIFINR